MLPPGMQESCHGKSEGMNSIIHAGGVRGCLPRDLPVTQAQSDLAESEQKLSCGHRVAAIYNRY
jgi:hypothetical protein